MIKNQLYMKKQLYGLHMKENASMLEHLDVFNMIITQVSVDDENKLILVLASLITSYDHLAITLMFQEVDFETRWADQCSLVTWIYKVWEDKRRMMKVVPKNTLCLKVC